MDSTGSELPTSAWKSEEDLIDALRRQDDDAYEYLVRAYSGRMLVVAKRFLGQDQDAQDAVQDAFLSAFKAIADFEGNSKLSTWLHRIVVNACLMKLRTRKRKPEKPVEDLLPHFVNDGHRDRVEPAWAVTFDTAVQSRETRDLVRDQIEQLPETYRTVLLLRDIEQLSTDETASRLNMSVSAVKTRLHRARQALKTLLDPHMNDGY
ncbi:RNA polymerase sigma factor [Bremerella cremea]|uniref:RNA polymerase sigma factor n=1 Tax=Bremerella cremea TaxID=1031537 RepID=UPI0031EA2244